ncbi:MAG: hypothetical protein FWD97_02700 [Defluviitaleaceae bacterium]|nr:hypothetical protein [Defluviitaleaceae bacterium]
MKKKIVTAGLCILAMGFIFANGTLRLQAAESTEISARYNQGGNQVTNQGSGHGSQYGDRGGNTSNSGIHNYSGTEYMPGINEQIDKILANQPAIHLDPNAYIVQHGESLWLVMGNIRAKLDILIYVDGKHMSQQQHHNVDRGNALPIYR